MTRPALPALTTWTPSLGARPAKGGTYFAVWAPEAERLEVILERPLDGPAFHPLQKSADGIFSGLVPGVRPGDLYRYRLNGKDSYPDPASRFQPQGPRGPSQVVDPGSFIWTDEGWPGIAPENLVVYELHVGTFTPAGTFAAAAEKLPYLLKLGVTAVEIMPVADFPGRWNWGYDGVDLFAPSRNYGAPNDLRRLIDAAHGLGLAVILDVVYNHLGPDGNYLGAYSPYYFTDRHQSPWGAGVNLDGEGSGPVRRFFIENALHWVNEYHADGLRLDAVHAMTDQSPRHFLAELSAAVRESAPGRRVVLIAEDSRNLAPLVKPEAEGGWGMDAVWADDFHHQVRRMLAGDREGYYRDYSGTAADLAETLRSGWFFRGQRSEHAGGPRGTDPAGLAPARFLFCLQNHDQVGNRALGERLHHQADPAAYRAAVALLLCAPYMPLLFMGQEWAASSPFLYFSDHNPELGRLITEGRRREFKDFSAFFDPTARERIPDPQAPSTFTASRLDWNETAREPHAASLRLHQALLWLRRTDPVLRVPGAFDAAAVGDDTVLLLRRSSAGMAVAAVRLRGNGPLEIAGHPFLADGPWRVRLSTEDPLFSPDPAPPQIERKSGGLRLLFRRPSAVILGRPALGAADASLGGEGGSPGA